MSRMYKCVKNEYIKGFGIIGTLIFFIVLCLYNWAVVNQEINFTAGNTTILQILYYSLSSYGFVTLFVIYKSVSSVSLDFNSGAVMQIVSLGTGRKGYLFYKLIYTCSLIIGLLILQTISVILISIISMKTINFGFGQNLIINMSSYEVGIGRALLLNYGSIVFDQMFFSVAALSIAIFVRNGMLSVVIAILTWFSSSLINVFMQPSFIKEFLFTSHLKFIRLLEESVNFTNAEVLESIAIISIYMIVIVFVTNKKMATTDL